MDKDENLFEDQVEEDDDLLYICRPPCTRSFMTCSPSWASFVVTRPPSPNAPRFLVGKKLNAPASPTEPAPPAADLAPTACAASSRTKTPCCSASALMPNYALVKTLMLSPAPAKVASLDMNVLLSMYPWAYSSYQSNASCGILISACSFIFISSLI